MQNLYSTANLKNVSPVHPVLLTDMGSQLAYQGLGRFAGEKSMTGANDHTFFTAGQHDVGATMIPQEPWFVGAHNRYYDVVIFVA